MLNEKPESTSPNSAWFTYVEDGSGNVYKVKLSNLPGGGGGGDVTAPTVVSAIVTTANQVVVVFSESVTATTAGWSFRRDTANWAITSVSGSGTTWTFLMATSAVSGEILDRSYDSVTGATVDGSANELVSFTNSAVTNSVAGITWTDVTAWAAFDGCSLVGGNDLLQSTSNSGARNALGIAAAGDGRARFTYRPLVVPAAQAYVLGFDLGATTENFATDLDHAAYCINDLASMYKSGSVVGASHAIADGDVIRIDKTGANVTLQKSTDSGATWTVLETTTAVAGWGSAVAYLKAIIAGASGPNTMDDIKHNGLV